mmetsp:Transcript_7125/g.14230  ORF Transcript_7125/g.14230 Transcript_7125/m.14230 type:complete len:447 (-) Transcript_7125:3600-4940(-)
MRIQRAVCRRPWLFLLFSALSLGLLSMVCQHAFSRNEVDKVARWRRIDINELKSSRFESYYRVDDLRVFHAHDICVRNNNDGLFVRPPLQGFAAREAAERFKNTPLSLEQNVKAIDETTEIRYFDDPTYIVNCWRRWETDTNPAHWMMKLGVLFSLSLRSLNYRDRANNEAVPRMDQILHIFFHQCANPFHNKWEWGQYVWRIISSSLPPASLTWAAGDPPGRSNATQKPVLYCFKSCFFDHNYGIWIQKGDIQQWQKALEPFSPEAQISQSERCCRIGIFQRKTGQSLRSFTNLNDLRLLAQKYSPYPIEIVSIDESEPVSKQIMIFNSFDILMSPHGSHLANLLFTSRKITLIEIISCAADEVFKENGELLGVDYILSTGHGTGASCPEAAKRSYLQAVSHHRGNDDILRCDISTKNCDVHVNLSVIESILASKTTPELNRRRM